MARLILPLIVLSCLIALSVSQKCGYGNFTEAAKRIDAESVLGDHVGQNVRLKGSITSLLSSDGTYAVFFDSGSGWTTFGILLTPANHSFSFPLDCVGCSVEVEGKMSESSFSNWTLPTTSISFYLLEVRAIRFLCDNVCQKFPNMIITKNLQDGDIHGPNGNCGGGRMCLAPGGIEPLHSTMHSTEIVTCISGTIHLKVDRGLSTYEDNTLGVWDAAVVPPGTRHEVVNESGEEACYIFVHSMVQM